MSLENEEKIHGLCNKATTAKRNILCENIRKKSWRWNTRCYNVKQPNVQVVHLKNNEVDRSFLILKGLQKWACVKRDWSEYSIFVNYYYRDDCSMFRACASYFVELAGYQQVSGLLNMWECYCGLVVAYILHHSTKGESFHRIAGATGARTHTSWRHSTYGHAWNAWNGRPPSNRPKCLWFASHKETNITPFTAHFGW